MSTPNASRGDDETVKERPSTNPQKERKTLMELTHESINEKLEEYRYNEADLLGKINKKDPSDIVRATREHMKRRWKENPSEYLDYSEQDFSSRVSNADIVDIYRKRLIDLQR